MKNFLSKFSRWSLVLMAFATTLSCEENKLDGDGDLNGDGDAASSAIKISNVVPTYNSVTFDVSAPEVNAIAYIALERGTEITAQEVFVQGDATSVKEGTFTYKGEGLESETDYTLYVAAKSVAGNLGPVTFDFTTAVNTGAPSSAESAGIRVESIGHQKLSWEVTNGSDVDFSLTMVQPTILMDNDFYEESKGNNITELEWLTGIMTYSGNGYLVRETQGSEAVTMYKYEDIYTLYPMYPDANYTIYTISFKGNYAKEEYEALEMTKVAIKTEAYERIGNPYVEVKLKNQDYIGLRHTLIPNADTKYWTKFFTKTAEITEFINYYDAKEGAGMGQERLKEYIQQVDPYVLEQSGGTDIPMSLGWGQEGIEFSRLALGFDTNLMPGDAYGENVSKVLEVDKDADPGFYEINVSDIGAGNYYINTVLAPNCYRVFWKQIKVGEYTEEMLADDGIASALAQKLDLEGWAEIRTNELGQEDIDTNINHDKTFATTRFLYGEPSDAEFQLVSVSLNYSGLLSRPVLTEVYHTLPRTLGDYEPAIHITAETKDVGKTNILVKYQVDEDVVEKDERYFFHRFYRADDPDFNLSEMTDDQIRDWLLAGEGYDNANCWTMISEDYEDKDNPYEYYFNWAGLETNTKYYYLYCSENGEGVVSKLKKVEFTTLSNTGGKNPEFKITVDPESIVIKDELAGTFSAKGTVAPNADVKEYTSYFIDEYALRSWTFNPDVEVELIYGLYQLVSTNGIPYIETAHISSDILKADGRVWLVAQGSGASGVESKMSFVEFTADGIVKEQVDADISAYIAAPAATPYAKELSISKYVKHAPKNDRSMLVNYKPMVMKSNASQREITEAQAAELRSQGVPFYSLRELGRKAILKEGLKK